MTHKNREKTFPALSPDWFCDWKFMPRNKDEVIKLFYKSGITKFLISWDSDDFGYVYYFTLIKNESAPTIKETKREKYFHHFCN